MKNKYEYKKILLLDKLRRQMNGAVVDSMKKYRGLEGLRSYGVSVPTIKDICREENLDHNFALYLFGSNVRELKLCAVFLDEPEKVEPAQIEEWISECHNDEIVSHAVHLFAKSRYADQYFNCWIDSDDKKLVRLALIMVGSMARSGKIGEFAREKILRNIEKCDYYTLNSFVSAITNISALDAQWRAEMLADISKHEGNDIIKELMLFVE